MEEYYSILITSFNRRAELNITLCYLNSFIQKGVQVIVCDDGSTDGTKKFVEEEFPNVQLISNKYNRGLIFSRNRLLKMVTTSYAISLDDDANFLSTHPLEELKKYFEAHHRCAVISFRIFWGLTEPSKIESLQEPKVVRSFVGCGHAWRMEAWKNIPNYPAWYEFYGEETFASLQLFKRNWEVHYLPSVLVKHRVNNKNRSLEWDYYERQFKSLRADWYNYAIFYPKRIFIWKILYSVRKQIENKVWKSRDVKIIKILLRSIIHLFKNTFKIIQNRTPLNSLELNRWLELENEKIYWKPEDD